MKPDSYLQHAPASRELERAQAAFGVSLANAPREIFRAFRGYQVHVDEHLPAGPSRGTVLLLHGGGAHGRALAPFAAPLLACGFRVLAPDLPGYGLTRGDASRTEYADWVDLVSELAIEAARLGPVVIYGLSAGGMTALLAARESGVASAVVATTLLDLSDTRTFDAVLRAPWLGRLTRTVLMGRLAPLFDGLALPLRWLVPLEALTSDPLLARALCDDPLIGGLRRPLRFFRSLREYTLPSSLDPGCPLLLAHPGADLWTPLALSLPVFDRLPGSKELVVLSNGSHAPLETPAFAELSAALISFLDRHVLQPPVLALAER